MSLATLFSLVPTVTSPDERVLKRSVSHGGTLGKGANRRKELLVLLRGKTSRVTEKKGKGAARRVREHSFALFPLTFQDRSLISWVGQYSGSLGGYR